MIKHDMPLTKENITDIKNLMNFRDKINLNPDKENDFIVKYLDSRNIDVNSEKANVVTKELKNFFVAIKNLNVDEILLFKENNIGLTKENLESFIKLFKGNSVIYNNLKDIISYLSNTDMPKSNMNNNKSESTSEYENFFKKIDIAIDDKELNLKNLEPIIQKNEANTINNSKNTTVNVEENTKNPANVKVNGYGKNNSINEIVNMIKKELNISDIDKEITNNVYKDIEKITTDVLVKEQIDLKTEEIKNIVKTIIENKLNLKPETYKSVMEVFNQNFNDIKIFNSISEQYYCLDLPIEVKENEYQLKLIIKDDRKKGIRIDSKNVRIATSVKTLNMGVVDAYIKINNNNMNIDIKCNEIFVRALDIGKEKLIMDLASMNYRVSVKVENKVNVFSLANCGEFFDDRSLNTINIKV